MLFGVPKDLRRTRIEQLLKYVELWERKDDFVKNFSGGMKRRLEIAREILRHPKILFLDEPTLGLDSQTRNHIWGYIKKLNQEEGITVLFTTHYRDEAEKMAGRLAIIDHGQIIIQGSVQELKEKTQIASLEEAFLALTGQAIREESVSASDRMRRRFKAHHY